MEEKKKSWLSGIWEAVKFIVITLLIVIPVRTYVAQPFIVSGSSMSPSFVNGEYLIVDALTYLAREPKRDEVIVFRYPKDEAKFFIKRVIGLPGETVVIKDNKTYIRQGGQEFELEDGPDPIFSNQTEEDFTLGDDEYFVMGDNRDMSLDSRSWGAVPTKLIKGRVLLRLFPLNRLGLLPASSFSP